MDEQLRDPLEFLPLTEPAFHALLALSSGDLHGYAVLKAVETQSGGTVRLSTGTLYGLLGRLLNEELISESQRRDPTDERRRLYHLTPLGHAVVSAERDRFMRALAVARSKPLLKPRST